MGSPGQHTTKLVLVRQVQPLEPTPQHHQSPTTATHTTTQRSSADTNQQQTTSKQTNSTKLSPPSPSHYPNTPTHTTTSTNNITHTYPTQIFMQLHIQRTHPRPLQLMAQRRFLPHQHPPSQMCDKAITIKNIHEQSETFASANHQLTEIQALASISQQQHIAFLIQHNTPP